MTKGISQTILHHAQDIKWREEGGRNVECSECWCLSFQVTIMCDGALLSWRWLNTRLPKGTTELTPCFALPVCVAFDFPIKLSLSQR